MWKYYYNTYSSVSAGHNYTDGNSEMEELLTIYIHSSVYIYIVQYLAGSKLYENFTYAAIAVNYRVNDVRNDYARKIVVVCRGSLMLPPIIGNSCPRPIL